MDGQFLHQGARSPHASNPDPDPTFILIYSSFYTFPPAPLVTAETSASLQKRMLWKPGMHSAAVDDITAYPKNTMHDMLKVQKRAP